MNDTADHVRVSLLGVPVEVWQRASAHQEAIHREFDILKANLDQDSVPNQLNDLVSSLTARFAGVGDETSAELHRAAEEGRQEIDLVYTVPRAAAAASRELASMLDRADRFCREGEEMLTLVTPPDLVAFRRWFLAEFSRQIEEGQDPLSWPEYERTLIEVDQEVRDRSVVAGTDSVVFEGELDLMTAGALRDQILLSRREEGSAVVELDLRGVTFIDSVGISLLVTAYKRLQDDGAEMRIILPERLRPLVEISGLVDVLAPRFVTVEGTRDI